MQRSVCKQNGHNGVYDERIYHLVTQLFRAVNRFSMERIVMVPERTGRYGQHGFYIVEMDGFPDKGKQMICLVDQHRQLRQANGWKVNGPRTHKMNGLANRFQLILRFYMPVLLL